MTCYKCGLPTHDGSVEHLPCCPGNSNQPQHIPGVVHLSFHQKERVELDWDKIRTFDDFKAIQMILGCHLTGDAGNPVWEETKRRLAKYLKP